MAAAGLRRRPSRAPRAAPAPPAPPGQAPAARERRLPGREVGGCRHRAPLRLPPPPRRRLARPAAAILRRDRGPPVRRRGAAPPSALRRRRRAAAARRTRPHPSPRPDRAAGRLRGARPAFWRAGERMRGGRAAAPSLVWREPARPRSPAAARLVPGPRAGLRAAGPGGRPGPGARCGLCPEPAEPALAAGRERSGPVPGGCGAPAVPPAAEGPDELQAETPAGPPGPSRCQPRARGAADGPRGQSGAAAGPFPALCLRRSPARCPVRPPAALPGAQPGTPRQPSPAPPPAALPGAPCAPPQPCPLPGGRGVGLWHHEAVPEGKCRVSTGSARHPSPRGTERHPERGATARGARPRQGGPGQPLGRVHPSAASCRAQGPGEAPPARPPRGRWGRMAPCRLRSRLAGVPPPCQGHPGAEPRPPGPPLVPGARVGSRHTWGLRCAAGGAWHPGGLPRREEPPAPQSHVSPRRTERWRDAGGGAQGRGGRVRDAGAAGGGEMASGGCPPAPLLLLLVLLPCLGTAPPSPPGCRIRITAKGLELVKQEGLRFVEQELQNMTVPDLHGKEGQFHYNISQVRVVDLQLPFSDLRFQPQQHLVFNIDDASISLRFRRQLLYWFFYDVGSINASAGGVRIHTALRLARDGAGRLKISHVSCNASIAAMHAGFSGTLRKVYEFLGTFIVTGMRFLLGQQICPSLEHAGLVLLNSLLDTVPVRNHVDEHVGIDYSLLRDPAVSTDTLDLDFKGMFFPRAGEAREPENHAVEPVVKETERMVYVAFSEFFFDSAMRAYFQAGVLAFELQGEKVPKDLEVLLRATFFGSIFMLSPAVDAPLRLVLQVSAPPRCVIKPSGTSVSVSAFLNISLVPPGHAAVQLSSMAVETKLSAKVFLQGKALRVQLDLRRFRIYSKQSALESLALFSLQAPLKTLLQLTIMPIINERTRKGVQIPLPEGMDFTKEVVTNHAGFLTVGADFRFSKGLREVIEKYRLAPGAPPSAAPSPRPPEPSGTPRPL
ncbi:phospholipid transfer protein [Rhynochetos jubatus]